MTENYTHANCAICHKRDYVSPLHGDKGGPPSCLTCIGKWHAEHGRRRRLGRIVIRAFAAYLDGNGEFQDMNKLALSATRRYLGFDLDPLGYLADTADTKGEMIELTSELLADAIKIAHPDLHPPGRRELAQRVTRGLLALQPFTFPAEKPKPEPKLEPASRSEKWLASNKAKPSAPAYPCKECAATIPYYYCAQCRAEWDRRQDKEREQESAKRRAQYARRKEMFQRSKPPTICASCGAKFKGKRTDARFCSDTCRQRAHRRVTDKKSITVTPVLAVTHRRDVKRDNKHRPEAR